MAIIFGTGRDLNGWTPRASIASTHPTGAGMKGMSSLQHPMERVRFGCLNDSQSSESVLEGQSSHRTPTFESHPVRLTSSSARRQRNPDRSWDITVCSPPLVPAVGIRWTSHKGRLKAVPTSRYSYPRPNWPKTRSYFD